MSSSILISKDIRRLIDDIRFNQELDNRSDIKKQVHFDASNIIDILIGMNSIFQGNHIRWDIYRRHSTLVYALCYKKWLGPIHVLIPHTEELIYKIQSNKVLFPDNIPTDLDRLEEEFWGSLDLKVHEVNQIRSNALSIKNWIDSLKSESIDLFKGVYLGSQKSFWKNRYKYLKDQGILRFSENNNYSLEDFTKTSFFQDLLKYLNQNRKKSSNNYVDTIALCLLDQKLKIFEKSTKGDKVLPLFFSDQEHIIEAVLHFSKQKDRDGHQHFTFRGDCGDFLIVRDANFFIIDGIFQAIKEKDTNSTEDLQNFIDALDSYSNQLHSTLISDFKPRHRIFSDSITRDVKYHLQSRSEEKVFLEFFNRWWLDNGYYELKSVIQSNLLDKKRHELDDQVHSFIEEERKKLNEQFSNYSHRVTLIKKTWNEFNDFEYFISRQFHEDGERLNVYKELGPQFSFTEKVCGQVQDLVDQVFLAVQVDQDLEAVKEEVATDILVGLFEKTNTREEEERKLNRLCKALGLLWVFEKFDLLCEVCTIVRNQFQKDYPDQDDAYPSPSIALMHAASYFKGTLKNEEEALAVIQCVERKYKENNYKVWIGLSYLYFLIWDENQDNFEFSELAQFKGHDYTKMKETDRYYNYLIIASQYAKNAIDYLEEIRKDDKEKQKYRQRRYYYALNNYLFFQVFLAQAQDFIELVNHAEKLEEIARNADYWQEDKYSDTLARFFFRLAFLSENQPEYKLNLDSAILNNGLALKSSKRKKRIYLTLQRNLEQLKIKSRYFPPVTRK